MASIKDFIVWNTIRAKHHSHSLAFFVNDRYKMKSSIGYMRYCVFPKYLRFTSCMFPQTVKGLSTRKVILDRLNNSFYLKADRRIVNLFYYYPVTRLFPSTKCKVIILLAEKCSVLSFVDFQNPRNLVATKFRENPKTRIFQLWFF